ncbi:hypothetical protein AB4Z46_07405 [Variovorax sp. M-6]|uniref:hypothetical protein n=1 Tax=Variovorax sp. M-6 TaxID=3233041 RepID=UPI003F951106
MDAILVIALAILEAAFILTGKGLVRVLSLGRWRGEALNGHEANIHAAAGALAFVLDGRRVVTVAGLTLAGAAFYGVLLTAVFWLATSW